ncbi:MAG: [FeFe] hydrogenase, group A [Phycisphaerae bacterium]
MENKNTLTLNGRALPIDGERNVLELARKHGVTIPTFCYHSELSVYGACRLCLVDIEGRGVVTSCSTQPEPGMVVKTNTGEIRQMRRIALELLLANHEMNCPTCPKSTTCKLQRLAQQMGIDEVECVHCGQCAAVCPTGALTPRSEIDEVWEALDASGKTVVVQVAPAVRVALGEHFGGKPGEVTTGQMVAALKALGFEQVYDTSFTADLTVIEEAEEFITRKLAGEKLPQFTSCCPGWVKFAEQYYPELLENLSTCRSPQQMFGAVARRTLPERLGVAPEDLVVVSVMPCTAKKAEAKRPEFAREGRPDVDHVLTTQELGRMIEQAGLNFQDLAPESLDMPMGFKTGAGVIFGVTGGVTEAVLRYAVEKVGGVKLDNVHFRQVRGDLPLREAEVTVAGITVKLGIVHGLAGAKAVAESIRRGECKYDLVEVMACPGGCIGGAGQPVQADAADARRRRTEGLYNVDKMLQLHKAQDNHMVAELYEETLGEAGSPTAHELLHTRYTHKRRLWDDGMSLTGVAGPEALSVRVCVGTNCFVKGSQELLQELMRFVSDEGLAEAVDVKATFCLERCGEGPSVAVGDDVMTGCDFEKVRQAVLEKLKTAVQE